MGGKNYTRILNLSKTRMIRSIYMPLMFALILSVSLQSVNAAWDVPPKAENKYCGAISIGAEVSYLNDGDKTLTSMKDTADKVEGNYGILVNHIKNVDSSVKTISDRSIDRVSAK